MFVLYTYDYKNCVFRLSDCLLSYSLFDYLTLSGPNSSGPRPNVLFSLLSPKTARISASVPNRRSSGNESATRKLHQMSNCKAVKQPPASFRLLLIESCAVICRPCGEAESWECDPRKLPTPVLYVHTVSILHVCMFTNMKLIPKAPCIPFQQLLIIAGRHDANWCRSSFKVFSIHCLHSLKRILISKPEAPFKVIIDDKEWMIS